MIKIRFRLIAPVVALATGACFATTKDVVQLQTDVSNARKDLQQQILAVQQQQKSSFDSLQKLILAYTDSLRGFETRFFATGGNLADNTSNLRNVVNMMIARVDAFVSQQETQSKQLAVVGEQLNLIKAALAADSNRTTPAEGPLAKLEAAERQLTRFPSASRTEAEEVIASNPDSAITAKAYNIVAESYAKEDRTAEADSVFRIIFEKYPNTEFAPVAMYRVGLSFKIAMKYADARALWTKVITMYPTSLSRSVAEQGIKELPPPFDKPSR